MTKIGRAFFDRKVHFFPNFNHFFYQNGRQKTRPWPKKSTQKSAAKFKSEFGTFPAKIHTARSRLDNQHAVQLYWEQISRGRFFIHEHPATASSWGLPLIQELERHPGVQVVTGDQLLSMFQGLWSGEESDPNPALRKKPRSRDNSNLAVRHEDSINILKTNTSFMLHVETTSDVLAAMYRVSRRWKEERETNGAMTIPLRLVLLRCLMQDLSSTLTKLSSMDKVPEDLVGKMILNADFMFLKKEWDPSQNKLVVRDGVFPLKDALTLFRRMVPLMLEPELIQRFHSMRPLSTSYTGATLPFFLEVGWRHPSSAMLWEDLNTLTQYSVFELQKARLRRCGQQRSALVQDIQKQLGSMSSRSRR